MEPTNGGLVIGGRILKAIDTINAVRLLARVLPYDRRAEELCLFTCEAVVVILIIREGRAHFRGNVALYDTAACWWWWGPSCQESFSNGHMVEHLLFMW